MRKVSLVILSFVVIACFGSVRSSAQANPSIKITVVSDTSNSYATSQNLTFKVPEFGKVLDLTNFTAVGSMPNEGYVWSDDPSNPSPGMNRDTVGYIIWVAPNVFDFWVSVEKFYVPTEGMYPRGFGPEVYLRVTIKYVNGRPQLDVQNRQTKMGYLEFNLPKSESFKLPDDQKGRQLSGLVLTAVDGTQIISGFQPNPQSYVALRIKKPDGKFVDFVTLTLEP